MIYNSAEDWLAAPQKRILFFGMSGLGKTYLSTLLRDQGDWFHYSIDYRIGTRYMGEYIADNAKREAMKVPFLRDLLMSDSIHISANVSFDDLRPVSSYLGKPGDETKGGLPYEEYTRRQEQFRQAEIKALMDTPYFIERAEALYGYPHFICDTGGSICEWVNPEDPNDPILKSLANNTLLVWLKGDESHTNELIRRFDKAPKPMSYQAAFLDRVWTEYLNLFQMREEQVNPDEFIRWAYAQALAHRQPRYEAMARNWGIALTMGDIAAVKTAEDFDLLIANALERSANPA
jgi:hypothetical protein